MIWLSVLFFIGGFLGTPLFAPINTYISHYLNMWLTPEIPSPERTIELRYRGIISEEEFLEVMKKHGYSETWAKRIYESYRRLITSEALLVLKWRGEISEEEFEEYRQKLGWSKEDWEKFEKAHRYFPSPSDLIRFSVREVWRPEVVAKYGYDQEFPEQFKKEAAKVGMSEEVAKWYWRAHWELPSLTQGYEMLARLAPDVVDFFKERYKKMGLDPEKIKTDLDTLRDLIRIHDIAPYWRDRLIAISYPPLPRVDIRRIYELALITDDELYYRLRDYGYSPKDAELMALFYRAYRIARSLRARYRKGWIDAEGVKQELLSIGIPEERVNEWVQEIVKADKDERLEKERDLTKSEIIRGVAKAVLTPDQGKTLLMRLGYDEWEAEYLLYIYGAYDSYWAYKIYNELTAKGASEEEINAAWEEAKKQLEAVLERIRTGVPVGSPETPEEFGVLSYIFEAARKGAKVRVPVQIKEYAVKLRVLERQYEQLRKKGAPKEKLKELENKINTVRLVLRRMYEQWRSSVEAQKS